MEDPELEAIRQRRMAEMQNSHQQAMAQQQAAEQRLQQMEIQAIAPVNPETASRYV